MPPDLALLSTLIGSNYPSQELIFYDPKGVPAIEVPTVFTWYCICSIIGHFFYVPKTIST